MKSVFDSAVENKLEGIRADLLSLANENKKLKDALATGKGLQKNEAEISSDELKRFATARIERASFEEILGATGVKYA